jgi:hypothetical protein
VLGATMSCHSNACGWIVSEKEVAKYSFRVTMAGFGRTVGGCYHSQWWCIDFDGSSDGMKTIHPQRCISLGTGSVLIVCHNDRGEHLSELVECRHMIRWKV